MTGAGGDGGPFGIFLFVLQQQQQYTLHTDTDKPVHSINSKTHTEDRMAKSSRTNFSAFLTTHMETAANGSN